jgi:hypothetical protein
MRFAYADPPYLTAAARHYAKHHDEAAYYDTVEAHDALIQRLVREFPDGWALSMSSINLHTLLPLCPPDVRVMAWVKPFASFKPGVNPGYAWEPVIVRGGRKRGREKPTVRDWVAANITMKKALPGAKPRQFCMWLFEVLGAEYDDELVDLFPGTGAVTEFWGEFSSPDYVAETVKYSVRELNASL